MITYQRFDDPCKHCGQRLGLCRTCQHCSFPISPALQKAWLAGYNAPADADSPFPMLQISPTEYIQSPGDGAWYAGHRQAAKERAERTNA